MKDLVFPDMPEVRIRVIQNANTRPTRYKYHGLDENDRIAINHGTGQRSVIEIPDAPWQYISPETCEDYSGKGEHYQALEGPLAGVHYMLCPGCGLDCT